MKKLAIICLLAIAVCCRQPTPANRTDPELLVAAAANLSEAFPELASAFTKETGIRVVFSFGATADLAKQIEHGAPFDVFAGADIANIDRLERQGLLTPGSRVIYARGRLVMWVPSSAETKPVRIEDVADKRFERVSIAKPDLAPYGQATVDSLRALGIWSEIEPKVVYAQNVSQAKQYASTGNAEVAFIPLALVKPGEGSYLEVEESLHQPIDQAMGIVKASPRQAAARRFSDFVLGEEAQKLLGTKGYRRPAAQ